MKKWTSLLLILSLLSPPSVWARSSQPFLEEEHSQASISLINNKGDIGKTLQEMSSSQNVRALALSVGTAAITGGALNQLGIPANDLNFTDIVQTQAIQTGLSTGISVLTQGQSLKEALPQAVVNMVGSIGGSYGAQQIGNLYHPTNPNVQPISSLEQKGLHFLNGAWQGALRDPKNPLKGAFSGGTGAVAAEIGAEICAPSRKALQEKAQRGTPSPKTILPSIKPR